MTNLQKTLFNFDQERIVNHKVVKEKTKGVKTFKKLNVKKN